MTWVLIGGAESYTGGVRFNTGGGEFSYNVYG